MGAAAPAEKNARQKVVPVDENIRFHRDVFTDRPFDWKSTPIDLRSYSFYDNTTAAVSIHSTPVGGGDP